MYNFAGLGKLLKLGGIENIFGNAVLQKGKQIDSINNNLAVFCHTKLISSF